MPKPRFPTPIRMIGPGEANKGTLVELDGLGQMRPVGGEVLFADPPLIQSDIDDYFRDGFGE